METTNKTKSRIGRILARASDLITDKRVKDLENKLSQERLEKERLASGFYARRDAFKTGKLTLAPEDKPETFIKATYTFSTYCDYPEAGCMAFNPHFASDCPDYIPAEILPNKDLVTERVRMHGNAWKCVRQDRIATPLFIRKDKLSVLADNLEQAIGQIPQRTRIAYEGHCCYGNVDIRFASADGKPFNVQEQGGNK